MGTHKKNSGGGEKFNRTRQTTIEGGRTKKKENKGTEKKMFYHGIVLQGERSAHAGLRRMSTKKKALGAGSLHERVVWPSSLGA